MRVHLAQLSLIVHFASYQKGEISMGLGEAQPVSATSSAYSNGTQRSSSMGTLAFATELPQYFVDFQVKASGLSLTSKYEWRQFALTGPVLDVYLLEKKTHSFRASDVSIQFMSETFFRLDVKGKRVFVLNVPSQSRLTKFQRVLQLASSNPRWSPPVVDVLTDLVGVATEIVEAETSSKVAVAASSVTIAQIQTHLAEMHSMYQLQASCSSMEELYDHLLTIEADYCTNVHTDNFAHTVHKLHPVQYIRSMGRRDLYRQCLKAKLATCPYVSCGHPIPVGVMYKVHIKAESLPCPRCNNVLSVGAFKIASFIAEAPQFVIDHEFRNNKQCLLVQTPGMPTDGRVESFMNELRRRMHVAAPDASRDAVVMLQTQVATLATKHLVNELGAFEIDLVQAMLRQLDFCNKMCPNMEYWTNPIVLAASMSRYHKFMHVMKVKLKDNVMLVPTSDIDLVWHTHQSFPGDYGTFCRHTVGRLVDHDDTINGGDLRKGYAETFLTWAELFDDAYSSFAPSYVAWTTEKTNNAINHHFLKKKWQKYGRLPSRDCRFVGVDEAFAVEALPYAMAVVVPDEKAVAASKTPIPDAISVYMAVIGTPVMDGRVRLQYSRHNYLMEDGGLGYVYYGGCGVMFYGGCMGMYGGYGMYGGGMIGGCGMTAGCASGGCASGCGGGGGCGGGCGG
ncbi:hypothetical protein B5M09_012137 [Aphanomyces astaci]|uniref:Uncharacterized protein n=2 Tax=Aphanomyces astaci TaxID=112090 RepID=A0A3R8DM03_APHAT|nr:hypothetical protein B5M09_012137 [Aphanomyces astaci]